MLDAYTIRKIAPRLLFAVIGVNLSIYLCVAAIDITNVVGHGIAQIIRAPFDIGGTLNPNLDEGSSNLAGPILITSLIGGAVLLAKGGGLAAIFALMLPVLVIVLLAVLTLVIRQALLVLLTLISPVAIVLSVLPGTDRFFRQWWDLFWRTLIIYPMVAALFAISDVLTAISFNNSNVGANTAGAVNIIGGIMFAFMPIALIPFTFRLSGGVLGAFSNATGNLRGMANQWSGRQLRQYAGKGYQSIAGGGLFKNTNPKQRWTGEYQKNEDGEYIDKDGNVTTTPETDGVQKMEKYGFKHRANVAASRAANLHKWNASERWGSVVAASDRAMIRQAAAVKESEEAKALAGFDDENYVMANFGKGDWHDELIKRAEPRFNYNDPNINPRESAERKRNLNNAISMMDAHQRVAGATAGQAAAAVELHGISTSYKDQYYLKDENQEDGIARDSSGKKILWDSDNNEGHNESNKGTLAKTSHDQMQETIYKASHGSRGLGNWIAAQSIGAAKQAGRYDMAASASAVLMYQEAMRSGDTKALKEMQDYYDKMMVERITPAQALQGHPRAAEGMANALGKKLSRLEKEFSDPDIKLDPEALKAKNDEFAGTLADIAGYKDALASSGSEAVTHFDKLLGRQFAGKDLMSHVEDHRGNEAFNRRRYEFTYRSQQGGKDDQGAVLQQRAAAAASAQIEQPPPTGGLQPPS